VIFDGNAIIHRAYHALPSSLTTRIGEPVNAVYGLTSMLLRVIQDLKPTHIAFAWDRPEPTFRHELLKSYQAQRPEADSELVSQFEKAYAVVRAMHVPLLSLAGYEADDMIGTITKQTKVDEVIVVTGDRDILQLVDDDRNIKLYMPVKGLSDAKLFGEKETVERMGVTPSQIVDFKGLVGDPSDNYKGIPGIGPKTAATLIEKYGSFDEIYKHINELPESTAKKLREHKDEGDLSYKLAHIITNAPIEFDIEEAKKWQVDSPELLQLFEEYGFRTLTKRVKDIGKQITSDKQTSLF